MVINKQDTNGIKALLQVGELGYDNYTAGGDKGRVFVGDGTTNIALAKKSEIDGKLDKSGGTMTGALTVPSIVVSGTVDGRDVSVDGTKLDGIAAGAQVNTVTSVASKTGAVALVKADVGLGNVDNTSDLSKPVSTATQTALDLKANLASPTFTGTVSGITKSMVGLGSVDNTADSAKAVASAGKWTTARKFSLSGGVTGSTSVDGSGNISLAATVDGTQHTHTLTNLGLSNLNLTRADKYLAAQNIADMAYDGGGNLIKIQYINATDVNYEVLNYTSGNLTSINHYVSGSSAGTTTLNYTGDNLTSVTFA